MRRSAFVLLPLVVVPLIVFACTEPRHATPEANGATPASSSSAVGATSATSVGAMTAASPTSTSLTPETGPGVVALTTEPSLPPATPFAIRSAAKGDELPAPAKVAQKTPKAKGCGEVHVGGATIPLMCRSSGYLKVLRASVPLLDAKTLSSREGFVGDAEAPTLVDHRLDGTEGPIRDQREVGACTAFSLASTIDHAYAHSGGKPGYVSVMHIWSRYANGFKEDAAENNLAHALTAESLWSYDPAAACKWVAASDCGNYCDVPGATCGAPDEAKRAKADALPHATLATVTKIQPTTTSFVAVLAKGQDIWFGMNVDQGLFERVSGKNAVVPDFDARDSDAGHAMSIVGYRVQANGTYFLLKNSWGKSWGDQGYAWIHETTLTRNIVDPYAYVLDVTPAVAAPATPPTVPTAIPSTLPTAVPSAPSAPTAKPTAAPTATGAPTTPPWFPGAIGSGAAIPGFGLPGLPFPGLPQPKPVGCAKGQVPDASTGTCVAPCADGSAPTKGKCATQNACPKGYVEFFGFCVVAAPTKSGLVPGSAVKYQCAAGGCLYVMPKGAEGCTSPVCTLACPSPKFVVARGPKGLHCSE
jgi:hypothetical protein